MEENNLIRSYYYGGDILTFNQILVLFSFEIESLIDTILLTWEILYT